MAGYLGKQASKLAIFRSPPQPKPAGNGSRFPALLQYSHNHLHFSPRWLQISGQRRNFSVGDAASHLLHGSQLLVTNIHALTGTPWFLSISLVALATNLTFRTPITWYAHQIALKRARLVPLIQAQAALIAQELRKKQVPQFRQRVKDALKERTRETLRLFAIHESRSIWGGLLTMPVFLSNLEVLRRMCGGPRGVLGNLLFASKTTASNPGAAAAKTGEATIENLYAAADSPGDFIAQIPLEPSFATEGCLWFPNLLEPDPYHVLPFAVSAVMVAHIIPPSAAAIRVLFGMKPLGRGVDIQKSIPRTALQRIMLLMTLAIGPLTMDLPAALHLYWFHSSLYALVLSKALPRVQPLPKQVLMPCKGLENPMMMPKPSKEI